MTAQSENAAQAEATIAAHNDRRGFVIESPAHGLLMLLVDLLDYADDLRIDFDIELERARETLAEVRAA